MGNIELKEAFANANQAGKPLHLDILSEEKIINDLFSYVHNTITGNSDKLNIDKLFPDSNVQS
jgi:hypothetical protein